MDKTEFLQELEKYDDKLTLVLQSSRPLIDDLIALLNNGQEVDDPKVKAAVNETITMTDALSGSFYSFRNNFKDLSKAMLTLLETARGE